MAVGIDDAVAVDVGVCVAVEVGIAVAAEVAVAVGVSVGTGLWELVELSVVIAPDGRDIGGDCTVRSVVDGRAAACEDEQAGEYENCNRRSLSHSAQAHKTG